MKNEATGKRKVLHIIDSFGSGGAETWLLACVKYLQLHPELDLQFDFLASGGKTGVYDDEVKALGATIYYEKYSLGSFFSFRKRFRKILATGDYCAVHDHQDFISGWHFLAGGKRLPRVRVAHLHNPWNFVRNYVTGPARWFSFRMGRLLTAVYSSQITGTSDAVMDEYGYNNRPYKKKRIAPAYCGFDVNRFAYDPSAKEKICYEYSWSPDVHIGLFAGRIGTMENDRALNQKNPEFALNIARALVESDQKWVFIFAGFKGNEGLRMEAEMTSAGLGDRIKFPGIRKDMPELMSASDVLLFPSLWEGLGMVAVEAQASGLHIAASVNLPEEAVVVKELVHKIALTSPVEHWVAAISNISNSAVARDGYQAQIERSGFSIGNSVRRLMEIYSMDIN